MCLDIYIWMSTFCCIICTFIIFNQFTQSTISAYESRSQCKCDAQVLKWFNRVRFEFGRGANCQPIQPILSSLLLLLWLYAASVSIMVANVRRTSISRWRNMVRVLPTSHRNEMFIVTLHQMGSKENDIDPYSVTLVILYSTPINSIPE